MQIGKLYDLTKYGTDLMDQRIGRYSTKVKSNKWKHCVWYYILDTTRVNIHTVVQLSNPSEWTHSGGISAISHEALANRKAHHWTVRAHVLTAAFNITGNPKFRRTAEVPNSMISFPKKVESKKQCRDCLSNCKGKDYKKQQKGFSCL